MIYWHPSQSILNHPKWGKKFHLIQNFDNKVHRRNPNISNNIYIAFLNSGKRLKTGNIMIGAMFTEKTEILNHLFVRRETWRGINGPTILAGLCSRIHFTDKAISSPVKIMTQFQIEIKIYLILARPRIVKDNKTTTNTIQTGKREALN